MPASIVAERPRRSLWVVVVLFALVLGGFAGLGHSSPASAALPGHGFPFVAPAHAAAPAAPRPALNTTLPFFSNSSSVGLVSHTEWYCTSGYCFPQAQNPSFVTLPDTAVGVGYSLLTTLNISNFQTCPSAPYTETRVAFSPSPDNGTTFNAPVFLPAPTSPCDWVQQMEPSFAVSGSTVWGAYISSNASSSALNGPWIYANPPAGEYTSRPFDGIAISNSTDNGTTFGPSTIITTGGNLADPQMVSIGKTLYILYENISNGTATLPSTGLSPDPPISENLLYSSNNGRTWNGPYNLPGENSSQNDSAMGGSISVNTAGELAVAYATNRSCINFCSASPYSANGDDVVVVTSTTNGTTWSPIHNVARAQGEITRDYYYTQFSPTGSGLYAVFQDSPMTSIAWGTGANLYIAWEAAPDLNSTSVPAYFYDYGRVLTYAGGSTNAGSSWTTAQVSPGVSNLTPSQGVFAEDWFNPTIGFHSGTVYLTFSYVHWGQGSPYSSYGDGYTANTYSQWSATSTNGYTYTSPSMMFLSTRSDGLAYFHNMGYHAAVGFNGTGAPMYAYALADGWYYPLYPGTTDQIVTLTVSVPYTGATTTVTVNETGLVPATPWTFDFNGAAITTVQSSVNITDVPTGRTVTFSWPGPGVPLGYRAIEQPVPSAGPDLVVFGPTTLWMNFTTFYGISFAINPVDFNVYLAEDNYGSVFPYQFYFQWNTYWSGSTFISTTYGNPFPWYFPLGTKFLLSPTPNFPLYSYYTASTFIGYWNGTGSGTYTGPGNSANLTVSSPFNETLWDLSLANYSVEFDPVGLPASSTYSFDVDGAPHSAGGTTPTVVPNLVTGPHFVTNISATTAATGWAYFGRSQEGNPLIVPVAPSDNLTFAFVNQSASPGTVSFHAIGVAAGSPWRLDFNGTEYSSTTPWINVTTRPGVYPVDAGGVVAANGTASLAAVGFGPTLNVSTSTTYSINFTGTYKLSVLSSTGGTVTPAGSSFWVAPNRTEYFNATASSGFTFGGWTGVGPGSYTGPNATAVLHASGPVEELASFVPEPLNRFNLTVNESGLPNGARWTVFLGGVGYSSNQSTFTVSNLYSCAVSGALGNYAVIVPAVGGTTGTEYLPTAATPTTACVTRPLSVVYTTAYALTVSATTGGVVLGATPGNVTWVAAGNSIDLNEQPAFGYEFVGWTGTGSGSVSSLIGAISVTPTGPVTEVAAWQLKPPTPTETFTVTFSPSAGLPSGTAWSVEFNGSSYATTSGAIVISHVINGTYPYSVPIVGGAAPGTRYQPAPTTTSVHVSGGNVPVTVPFGAQYWVAISAVGSGAVRPSSGWFSTGTGLTLNATPTGGTQFAGWTGTGNGNYTGPLQGPTIHVLGPITEQATFVLPPTTTTTPSTTSVSPSTVVIAGLAVVGLVVGVVVGVVLARRGRPPAGESGSTEGSA